MVARSPHQVQVFMGHFVVFMTEGTATQGISSTSKKCAQSFFKKSNLPL
jgi:hypothetical protein